MNVMSSNASRRRGFRATVLTLMLVTTVLAGSAAVSTIGRATEGDIGYLGPSTAGISGSAPTGAKPESKLWWNDGSWWGVLFDSVSEDHHIFKLDRATQTWLDTGIVVDERDGSRADAMWDGTHLYIASHIFTTRASIGSPSRLYRFSYDAATGSYSRDSGFPVTISGYQTETLVIDKDSTGRLWATWTQNGEVWINRTTGSDDAWGSPFRLPVTGTTGLAEDDISSLVSFGGNKIGVMWSHQPNSAMYFAVHEDGQADDAWDASRTAIQGPGSADDHINLKSLQSDGSGRVFAAVKTSLTSSSSPLNLLLARDPATGDWTSHTFGQVSDHHTRPILILDETNRMVHMFATSGESGGTIYGKSTPIDAISFPPGKGKPVIRDAASADVNDATSTKQNVNSTTGLVVLASNDTTDFYWHSYDSLTLDADFKASQTFGTAPMQVQFTDASNGYPVSWSWDFGDGSTSTEQNPAHTYTAPGSYTVAMTATDASGAASSKTRTDYVTVLPSVSFKPIADAYVSSTKPTANYGHATTLRARYQLNKTTYRSYLTFDVSGLTQPVQSAKLRLWVTNGSSDGGTVFSVADSWTELGITWNNAPALESTALGRAGSTPVGVWKEIDLPASFFAPGNQTYRVAITSTSPDDVVYGSRETTTPPQLVLGVPPG